jgi:hypothetical protein
MIVSVRCSPDINLYQDTAESHAGPGLSATTAKGLGIIAHPKDA